MKREPWIAGGICAGVALLAIAWFWPAASYDFLHWDDDIYLAETAHFSPVSAASLRWMFTTTQPFYYQPLTWLSFSLNVPAGKNPQPAAFHITNIVLHGLNAALAAWLTWLIATAGANGFHKYRLGAMAGVGLLFAVHPLQVEAVAWVAERKTLLCAFFCLVSVGAYLIWVRDRSRRGWWHLAIGAYLAALASKPLAMTVPAALLALDFVPLQRHRQLPWWQLLKEKWLWLALAFVDLISTVRAQSHMQAVMKLSQYGWGERALIAMRGVVFYLWKLVWPAWLSPFYPLDGDVTLKQPEYLVPLLICLALTIVSVWRARRWPALAVGWGCFVALLIPMLGLAQVGSQAVADRFMYLAMLVPLMLLAWSICWLTERGTAGATLASLVIGCLALKTRQQLPVWKDDASLWSTVVAYYPDCGIAQGNLAAAELRNGQSAEALQRAIKAVDLLDDYPNSYWVIEDYYFQRHEYAAALPYAARSVTVSPQNAMHRMRYGFALLRAGQIAVAREQLQQAVDLDPLLAPPRYFLISALSQSGRFEEAWTNLDILLAQNSGFARQAAMDQDFAGLRTNALVGGKVRARLAEALAALPPPPAK